jgi:hypothetical protein
VERHCGTSSSGLARRGQLDQQAVVQPLVLRLTADSRRTDSTPTEGLDAVRHGDVVYRDDPTERRAHRSSDIWHAAYHHTTASPEQPVATWPSSHKPDDGQQIKIMAPTKQDLTIDKTG